MRVYFRRAGRSTTWDRPSSAIVRSCNCIWRWPTFQPVHASRGTESTARKRSRFGIAADARWIWHEIGHVLLMCSVGELEFRFAHSAGDALAAIVSDPQSQLAGDGNWRGATFPWMFTPRRHDRCVSHGWSWGGSLHYAMSQVTNSTPPRRKGYWTEQNSFVIAVPAVPRYRRRHERGGNAKPA